MFEHTVQFGSFSFHAKMGIRPKYAFGIFSQQTPEIMPELLPDHSFLHSYIHYLHTQHTMFSITGKANRPAEPLKDYPYNEFIPGIKMNRLVDFGIPANSISCNELTDQKAQ